MQYKVIKIHRNEFVFNTKALCYIRRQIKYMSSRDVRIDLLVEQINIDAGLKEMYLLLLEISLFCRSRRPRLFDEQ